MDYLVNTQYDMLPFNKYLPRSFSKQLLPKSIILMALLAGCLRRIFYTLISGWNHRYKSSDLPLV
jgi:hypothetical protein